MRFNIDGIKISKAIVAISTVVACVSMMSLCIFAIGGEDEYIDIRCIVFLVSCAVCIFTFIMAFDVIGTLRRFGLKGLVSAVRKAVSEAREIKEEKELNLARDQVLCMVISRYQMSEEELACIIEALTFGHENRPRIEELLLNGHGKEIAYAIQPVIDVWKADEICANTVFELENSSGIKAAEEVAASIVAFGRDRGIDGLIDAVYAGLPVEDVIA